MPTKSPLPNLTPARRKPRNLESVIIDWVSDRMESTLMETEFIGLE